MLRPLEEQMTDAYEVRRFLLRDLSRLGMKIEARDLKQEGLRITIREQSRNALSRSEVHEVLDVYARTYPDYEFFLVAHTD